MAKKALKKRTSEAGKSKKASVGSRKAAGKNKKEKGPVNAAQTNGRRKTGVSRGRKRPKAPSGAMADLKLGQRFNGGGLETFVRNSNRTKDILAKIRNEVRGTLPRTYNTDVRVGARLEETLSLVFPGGDKVYHEILTADYI